MTTGTETEPSPARKSATTRQIAAFPSMPILIPAGGMSSVSVCSMSRRRTASTGLRLATPTVDCTVNAVRQAVPKRPMAAKTCRSAVAPAPEEGSKPAIVSATAGLP